MPSRASRTPRPRRASTARGVKRLPASAFAYPKTRQYPINTLKRARNALTRAAQPGTSGSYQHVARAVRRKWGNRVTTVGKAKGTTTRPGLRRRGRRR
jgi:hypothetical protein